MFGARRWLDLACHPVERDSSTGSPMPLVAGQRVTVSCASIVRSLAAPLVR